MERFHSIFFFEFSESLKEWNASFKSNTDKISYVELPKTENVSFNNGYTKLFFAILTFECLKSAMTLLSFVTFLLINITGLEYVEKPSFISLDNTIFSFLYLKYFYLLP